LKLDKKYAVYTLVAFIVATAAAAAAVNIRAD
jgi:hypothetical protein